MRSSARLVAGSLFTLCLGAMLLAAPAQATLIELSAVLLGVNETPPNASPATGFADVVLDDVLGTLKVHETFSGLIGGPAAAAHIHCCASAGIAAPVRLPFSAADGFPFGATSGTFDHTYVLATALTGISVADFIAGFEAGNTYANILNATFPGGEIRGQLVPEPASILLLGVSLAGLTLVRRRRAR